VNDRAVDIEGAIAIFSDFHGVSVPSVRARSSVPLHWVIEDVFMDQRLARDLELL
jgi:hypothetical protein